MSLLFANLFRSHAGTRPTLSGAQWFALPCGKWTSTTYLLSPSDDLHRQLPLPCIANSRYMNFDHLKSFMEFLGFTEIRERWRKNGKMGYWLYRKADILPNQPPDEYKKKNILRSGNRNNFAITLAHRTPEGPKS